MIQVALKHAVNLDDLHESKDLCAGFQRLKNQQTSGNVRKHISKSLLHSGLHGLVLASPAIETSVFILKVKH